MDKFSNDRKIIKEAAIGHYNEKKYKEAMGVVDQLEREVAAIKKLKQINRSREIKPLRSSNQSEATALVVLSDTHCDEVVNPNTVQGRNKYNPEIAQKRMERFFQLVVRLTTKERQDVAIDNLVICFLGDFISGVIHEELLENTAMRPMEAIRFVQGMLHSGLNFIKTHGKFRKIVVICKDGNHGRITHKIRTTTRTGNSLEWLMYHTLAALHPDIEWVIEDSYLTYFMVYGTKLRLHHGDWVKSAGGVGGLYPAMLRAIYQWNISERAHVSISGHKLCPTVATL
jgi:hypothetical protein